MAKRIQSGKQAMQSVKPLWSRTELPISFSSYPGVLEDQSGILEDQQDDPKGEKEEKYNT